MRISDWSSDVCSSDLSALQGSVAFFGHDWAESTVVKRIRAFSGLGLRVVGFNFRRDKFAPGFQPFWDNVHLGATQDRAYLKRLLDLLQALPRVLRHRRALREADRSEEHTSELQSLMRISYAV